LVGHHPPAPYPAFGRPKIHPSLALLRVSFDKDIQQPSKTAFIKFCDFILEKEVYKIDASLSREVTFNSSKEIKISPNYLFIERNIYYIIFDRDVVQGVKGCGPVNEPVMNKTFWSFEVIDVTPPMITLTVAPVISNDTISMHWNANENVT